MQSSPHVIGQFNSFLYQNEANQHKNKTFLSCDFTPGVEKFHEIQYIKIIYISLEQFVINKNLEMTLKPEVQG